MNLNKYYDSKLVVLLSLTGLAAYELALAVSPFLNDFFIEWCSTTNNDFVCTHGDSVLVSFMAVIFFVILGWFAFSHLTKVHLEYHFISVALLFGVYLIIGDILAQNVIDNYGTINELNEVPLALVYVQLMHVIIPVAMLALSYPIVVPLEKSVRKSSKSKKKSKSKK